MFDRSLLNTSYTISAQDLLVQAERRLQSELKLAMEPFKEVPYGEAIAEDIIQRFDRLDDLQPSRDVPRLRLVEELAELQRQVEPLANQIHGLARVCWRLHDLNRAYHSQPEVAIAMARTIVRSWPERSLEELTDLSQHAINVELVECEGEGSEEKVRQIYQPLVDVRRAQVEAKVEECLRNFLCVCASSQVSADRLQQLFDRRGQCERALSQPIFARHLGDFLLQCQDLARDYPAVVTALQKYKKFQERFWMLASLSAARTDRLKAVGCALRALAKSHQLFSRTWGSVGEPGSRRSAFEEYCQVMRIMDRMGPLLSRGKDRDSAGARSMSRGSSSSSTPSDSSRVRAPSVPAALSPDQFEDEDDREMFALMRGALRCGELDRLIGHRLFNRVWTIAQNLSHLQINPKKGKHRKNSPTPGMPLKKEGGGGSGSAERKTPAATPAALPVGATITALKGITAGSTSDLSGTIPSETTSRDEPPRAFKTLPSAFKPHTSPPTSADSALRPSGSAFSSMAGLASREVRPLAIGEPGAGAREPLRVDVPAGDPEILALSLETPARRVRADAMHSTRVAPGDTRAAPDRAGSVVRELELGTPVSEVLDSPDEAIVGISARVIPRTPAGPASAVPAAGIPLRGPFSNESGDIGVSAFAPQWLEAVDAAAPVATTTMPAGTPSRPASMVPLMDGATPGLEAATPSSTTTPVTPLDALDARRSSVDADSYPMPLTTLPSGWVQAIIEPGLSTDVRSESGGDFVCIDSGRTLYREDAIRAERRADGSWVVEVAILDTTMLGTNSAVQGFESVSARPAVVVQFHVGDDLLIQTLRVSRRMVRVAPEQQLFWPSADHPHGYCQGVELIAERANRPLLEFMEWLGMRRDAGPGARDEEAILKVSVGLLRAEGIDVTSCSDMELRERAAGIVARVAAHRRNELQWYRGFTRLGTNAALTMQLLELVRDPMQCATNPGERAHFPTGAPRDILHAGADAKKYLEQAIRSRNIYSFNPRESSVSAAASSSAASSSASAMPSWDEIQHRVIERMVEALRAPATVSGESPMDPGISATPSPTRSPTVGTSASAKPAWLALLQSRQYKGPPENLERFARAMGMASWIEDDLLNYIRDRIIRDPEFGRSAVAPRSAKGKDGTPKRTPDTPKKD